MGSDYLNLERCAPRSPIKAPRPIADLFPLGIEQERNVYPARRQCLLKKPIKKRFTIFFGEFDKGKKSAPLPAPM